MVANRRAIFEAGGIVYDAITSQALWREQAARLLEHSPSDRPLQRVLDVGCGPGMSAFALAQNLDDSAQVVGADLSARMVSRAKRYHRRLYSRYERLSFHVADATRLPFKTNSFDLVTGHSFLYLVPNQPGVLSEIRRVLSPGGTLVLMEPRVGGSLIRAGLGSISRSGEVLRRPLTTLRFLISMLLWRFVSWRIGPMTAERIHELFGAAGFSDMGTSPTLGGLGMHCFGRKL